ncbi:MAG: ATP-binding cassette domain-containing protein, partial [Candidatus Cloacimonas sp.]|nr:ATP-binding cassette domain-containing protein [Candidatus Cloacimonas sp.]
MKLEFKNLTSTGGLCNFCLQLEVSAFTVLFDAQELLSNAVLSVLIGLDEIEHGSLLLDGVEWEEYFTSHQLLSTFGYVFDEGIMLANLSLKENLLLPWRKRYEGANEKDWEQGIQQWLQRLELDIDLSLRPVSISAAQRKFLGYVRSLMLKPQLLLIDDPYYLLSKRERALLFNFLSGLKDEQPMLIASADDDFSGAIATKVV